MAEIDMDLRDRGVGRYSVLNVLAMVGASLVALAIGICGAALLVPDAMGFSASLRGQGDETVFFLVGLYMSAGPVIAGLSLLAGWLIFSIGGSPRWGRKAAFYPPVVWGVLLLAYMAGVSSVCGGEWTCGI